MKKTFKFFGLGLTVLLSLSLISCSTSTPTAEQTAPSNISPSETPNGSASPVTTSKDDPLDNGGHAEYTWDDYVKATKKESGLSSWPEVERIRYVSREEWPEVQANCRTSLGFPTTVEKDGSISTAVVDGQEIAEAEATYTCDIQYPEDLKYAQAFTRTQWRVYYAYYRDSLIPCLQELGLEPGSLPSEETYVEGMASASATWSPYNTMDVASADTTEMDQKCPPVPPAKELYGN